MSIMLTIDEGDGLHRFYEAAETVVLGRDKRRVHVFLNDDFVSREHATIQRRKDGQWHFIHRGRNASRLDDRFLDKPGEQMVLHDKSVVQVGRFRITCHIDEEPATEIISSRLALETADLPTPEERDEGLDDESRLLQETQVELAIPRLGALEDADADAEREGGENRSRAVQLHALADQMPESSPENGSVSFLEDTILSDEAGEQEVGAGPGGDYETLDMSEHILAHQARIAFPETAAYDGASRAVADSGSEPNPGNSLLEHASTHAPATIALSLQSDASVAPSESQSPTFAAGPAHGPVQDAVGKVPAALASMEPGASMAGAALSRAHVPQAHVSQAHVPSSEVPSSELPLSALIPRRETDAPQADQSSQVGVIPTQALLAGRRASGLDSAEAPSRSKGAVLTSVTSASAPKLSSTSASSTAEPSAASTLKTARVAPQSWWQKLLAWFQG